MLLWWWKLCSIKEKSIICHVFFWPFFMFILSTRERSSLGCCWWEGTAGHAARWCNQCWNENSCTWTQRWMVATQTSLDWSFAVASGLFFSVSKFTTRAVRRLLSSGVQTRLSGIYPCEDFGLWSFLVAVFPPLELQFSPSGLFLSSCLMSATGSWRSQTATHRWLERKERKDGDPQSWWKDKVSCGHVFLFFFFERGAQYKHLSTDDELNAS